MEEINSQLSSVTLLVRPESDSGQKMSTATSPQARAVTSLPKSRSKPRKSAFVSKKHMSIAVDPVHTEPLPFGPTLDINFHISLLNVAPAMFVQSRPLPRYYQRDTKLKYDKLVYVQWKMPEIADLFFCIDDLLPMSQAKDKFYAEHYFLVDRAHKTAETEAQVNQDVTQRLKLYTFLCKHRRTLRDVFVSYNLEAMQLVREILSMNFATYLRLLKDLMLLSSQFDVIEAVKVFYKSVVHSKALPDFTEGNEKKWLTDLLRSFNFEANYRLKLPEFIESLVRLAAVHPRFTKMPGLSVCDKFVLFYKRILKPNVRLVLGVHYRRLLADVHVLDTMSKFEPDLYVMYTAYQTRLSDKNLLLDFKGRHLKVSLPQMYSLFGDSHLLKPGEIITKPIDSLEADIESIRDDEIPTFHDKKPSGKRTLKQVFARNRVGKRYHRATEIRFPSSSTASLVHKSERIPNKINVRSMSLLPFARPLKNQLLLDRAELFSLFLSAMEVANTQGQDELFLGSASDITDDDFVMDFAEFTTLIGLVAVHSWKTVAVNREYCLVEALYLFLKTLVTSF